MKYPSWILLLVLASAAVEAGGPEKALGPMAFTGQTPLQTLRLDIVPTRHDLLAPGRWEFSVFNSLTNRWNASSYYLLDVETLQNVFYFTVGVAQGQEVGLVVPVVNISGGRLDRLIVAFHDTFGLDQDGRTGYPYNSLRIILTEDSGESLVIIDEDDQGTTLGDLAVFSRTRLYEGGNRFRSLLLTVLLKFPTTSERQHYGSGGTDGAMSLASMHEYGRFDFYTTIGYGVYGSGNRVGVDLKPYQWTFFAAVEYRANKNISLIAQNLSNSGVARDFDEFSRPTHELILGVKQHLSPQVTLEYGLMENLFFFSNSVDFGLNFGLTYRP